MCILVAYVKLWYTKTEDCSHIRWLTGGSRVPKAQWLIGFWTWYIYWFLFLEHLVYLSLIHCGLCLEKLLWPRPHSLRPRILPRAKLTSLDPQLCSQIYAAIVIHTMVFTTVYLITWIVVDACSTGSVPGCSGKSSVSVHLPNTSWA